ncbi:MAG TPA: GDP-mannose 4,6-dehydratase [Ardenticatenaceae bacterium]|nr:GDP-mannose 4,6-dehydratase [Ardenticatenaceae bacterium]
MRSLITGIGGVVGSYLAEELLTGGNTEVWGVVRKGPGHAAHLQDRLRLVEADLTDPQRTEAIVDEVRPERVYHLAGQSDVGGSWRTPWATFETNVRAQLNMLEALARLKLDTRVLVVGSQEEYGKVRREELPTSEEAPLRPDSPYGVSKVAQDLLGLQYFQSYKVHTVRVRPFNHIGPRQSDRFVAAAFARQIAEAEAGLREATMLVGNLDSARDFTDVRDVVHAYRLVLDLGQAGEVYNVGSGKAYRIRALLGILLDLSSAEIAVSTDPGRLRPADVRMTRADTSKIRAAAGWEPLIPFERSVQEVLEYWRAQARAQGAGSK